MKFDCKGSCDGTFICIIRIRNKEIENTEHWQTFQKDFEVLVAVWVKGKSLW